MALYRKQIAEGAVRDGEPFKSDLSESVMNGFLLEMARILMVRFARMKNDRGVEEEWNVYGKLLSTRLQSAWRNDFFARAFINRSNELGVTYLGAAGDGRLMLATLLGLGVVLALWAGIALIGLVWLARPTKGSDGGAAASGAH